MIRMASFDQAIALLREHGEQRRLAAETVSLSDATGRRLASAASARVDQPPADVSAMDGYAVRRHEAQPGAALRVVGESRAGTPFSGDLPPGSAVRIFTGAHVPPGADHILIQEEARRFDDHVAATQAQTGGSSIRRRGRDFEAGHMLVPAGQKLTAGAIALLAAGNIGSVAVRRRPRVAVLANGDELVEAGEPIGVGQIANSIQPALLALANHWGAEAVSLGVARDQTADVQTRISASDADIIVSIGGASVGEHDIVRSAFAAAGFQPIFEKVSVKPGKPTWFSQKEQQLVLGLPGNPAAAMVTARLFLRPLLGFLMGIEWADLAMFGRLERAIGSTGDRDEFLRARADIGSDGLAHLKAMEDQDSSLLNPFLAANALIRRTAGAPAASAGEQAQFIWLDNGVD